MKVNLEFIVLAYFIGMFVDWVFQTDWQASNKSKWGKNDNKLNSALALISHSVAYAGITTFALLGIMRNWNDGLVIFFTLFISHAIIDSRVPVKFIMRYLKCMTNEQIYNYRDYGFMHIGIDHRLHEIVIMILGFII